MVPLGAGGWNQGVDCSVMSREVSAERAQDAAPVRVCVPGHRLLCAPSPGAGAELGLSTYSVTAALVVALRLLLLMALQGEGTSDLMVRC